MSLFNLPICDHCKKEIFIKKNSCTVLDGFFDQDTKQNVCMGCKSQHYKLKQQTKFANLFSEVPLTIKP